MSTKMVSVNITLDDAAAKSAAATLTKLKSLGLREAKLLEAIGIVTGRVAAEQVETLATVPGITVALDETVEIPPPDSEIQ